jgi:hypothetical protein
MGILSVYGWECHVTFDWVNEQELVCKHCKLPVFIPSWMVGRPYLIAQLVERKEFEHGECKNFPTPEEAQLNRKWRIGLHYAAIEAKRKEQRALAASLVMG